EVDADVGELLRPEVADEAREREDGHCSQREQRDSGQVLASHTRLVTGCPKSLAGLTRRTTRMIRSAPGSRRPAPTKSTYVPIRFSPTPSISPPATAPKGARIAPRTG